jgi:hypothetical protein
MISARQVVVVRPMKRRGLSLAAILAAAASLVPVIGPMLNPGPSTTSAIPTVEPSSTPTASLTADPVQHSQPVSLELSLVLFHAPSAAEAQQGGWPDAAYWHTVSSYHQGTGPTLRRESWMGHKTPACWRIPAPAAPGP